MKIVTSVIDKTQSYFEPDPKHAHPGNRDFSVSLRFLALLVGCIAFGLPAVMGIGVMLGACFFHSISHFYYAQFLGGVFIAFLAIIGTVLLAYRGESKNESRFAFAAGLSAFGVALFPTSMRGCETTPYAGRILADQIKIPDAGKSVEVVPVENIGEFFELFSLADEIHFASAVVLFVFLAFYSFFIFTRVKDDQRREDGSMTEVKRNRNVLYIISGIIISISIAAIGLHALPFIDWPWWNEYKLTFWFELTALWAFGFSWMLKGRFFGYLFLDLDEIETEG